MKYKHLKQLSPLTYCLERLFFCFQLLSPATHLFGTRHDILKTTNIEADTAKRARQIEMYLIVWVVITTSSAVVVAWKYSGLIHQVALWLSMFRVFDICQAVINMNIFDQLRFGQRPHYTAFYVRTLILSAANFLEIAVCFATLYAGNPCCFHPVPIDSWADAFYFSSVTQLTIGYGDITPLGSFRLVAAVHGFLGFFFAIAVIGRFVSLLPKMQSVLDDNDASA